MLIKLYSIVSGQKKDFLLDLPNEKLLADKKLLFVINRHLKYQY